MRVQILSDAAFQRLLRYGCNETEAFCLASHVNISLDSTDEAVENEVISALVNAKQAVDGIAEIEFLGGQRRDVVRALLTD